MTSTTPTTFAQVALQLHANGYRPFPGLQETKVPAMKGWTGLNRMPWDEADLAATITDYRPAENYAACLAIQSELVAVDIDIAAPTAAALRPYLAQFLSDHRVIEIPKALWWFILHGIILRTRPFRSARM